jgi:SAM-dependent methyltransferase
MIKVGNDKVNENRECGYYLYPCAPIHDDENFYTPPRLLYNDNMINSLKSAREVIPMIHSIFNINNAIDLGCRNGEWLLALKEKGCGYVIGVDIQPPNELLLINVANYIQFDLSNIFINNMKYDIAISLEVAEHIPKEFEKNIITSLINLSDIILFSAAIPCGGGEGHINEQPQSYWAKMFITLGYTPIDLRPLIWGNDNIRYWYRQNMVLYIRNEKVQSYKLLKCYIVNDITTLDIIHPKTFYDRIKRIKNEYKQQ